MTAERTLSAYALRTVSAGATLYVLRPGLNRIGSSAENDIRLRDAGISKLHARLEVRPGELLLEDLASKNGTFVNGARIATRRVAPGDTLGFGPLLLGLEPVASADTRLAIGPASRSGSLLTASSFAPGETPHLGGDPADLHELLTGFVERLPEPWANVFADPSALDSALRQLAEGLGARGAALLEPQGAEDASGRDWVLLAGSLPLEAFAAEWYVEPSEGTIQGQTGDSTWLLARAGRGCSVLAIWGQGVSAHAEPVAGLAAQILARWVGSGDQAVSEPGNASGPGAPVFPPGWVRGESPAMSELYRRLAAVAPSDLPVLILGETGVGKEGIARMVHDSSPRRDGPRLAINCAAIPTELLEAELFGIGKGVATGVEGRLGKFQQASGGTLFLDEIGEMPPALQAKLLRALQEGEVQPVGGMARAIDVRVIAATNCDLSERVERGEFRADLYFRLAGMPLHLPALRHRPEDLPALVAHFLRRASRRTGHSPRGMTVGALEALRRRPWPGNVRQLEHAVGQLVVLCPPSQPITSDLVDSTLGGEKEEGGAVLDLRRLADLDLASLERAAVEEALSRAAGNQSRAAPLLGISRESLRRRMARYGLLDAS